MHLHKRLGRNNTAMAGPRKIHLQPPVYRCTMIKLSAEIPGMLVSLALPTVICPFSARPVCGGLRNMATEHGSEAKSPEKQYVQFLPLKITWITVFPRSQSHGSCTPDVNFKDSLNDYLLGQHSLRMHVTKQNTRIRGSILLLRTLGRCQGVRKARNPCSTF